MIFGQAFKNFEVIVVDSGSTDGALEYLQQFPVKIIHYDREKFNYARAFNLGARSAKGEILVRLSGDVIPANDRWLEELLKSFSDPRVGAAYSKHLASSSSSWHHRLSLVVQMGRFRGLFEKLSFGILFWGASAAIRRNLWEQVPFDESIEHGEEGYFAAEIVKRGHKIIFAPDSLVHHSHHHSFGESLRRLLLDARNVWRIYPPVVWWKLTS